MDTWGVKVHQLLLLPQLLFGKAVRQRPAEPGVVFTVGVGDAGREFGKGRVEEDAGLAHLRHGFFDPDPMPVDVLKGPVVGKGQVVRPYPHHRPVAVVRLLGSERLRAADALQGPWNPRRPAPERARHVPQGVEEDVVYY
ncbi:uncharacterized protein PgNI_09491 [Pyricularia grisea]|uniref:Secreted protein n=1 Tax=Pyricularia grisea TaxID=148305 RepID=A0A6P8AR60_PYRGI|nr:uncharacterized protein PgNI_09491 [Pyricularia grisea]TLD04611.1 hypothetical protein PgNI_09491 [Pyricularia grisea]